MQNEFDRRHVPRQLAQDPNPRLNLVIIRGLLSLPPFSAIDHDGGLHLYRHPPSGQSRIRQVAQSRTDGVHRREPAGTRTGNP